MVSPVLYEHYYDGAFLIREAAGYRSRDTGVISNSTTLDLALDAGLVMVNNADGTIAATANVGNTGNGTVGSTKMFGGPIGTYEVLFTAATVFRVFDPLGKELQDGHTGTAYTDEIGLTITAGGTAFVAGDGFAVAVAAATPGWTPYTASTPAEGVGILYNRTIVPASGSKKATVITREAEVNRLELCWDPTVGAAGSISGQTLTNTGNGTLGSLSIISAGTLLGGVDPFVPSGTYTLTALNEYTFQVADQSGEILNPAQVGTAYADEIGFTITQGATVFAEGDGFTVVVTENGQTAALAALAAAGIIAR